MSAGKEDGIDYQALLDRIYSELEPRFGAGQVARYIPELARVSPRHFGMALVTPAGELYTVGDAHEKFSIQSVSKIFTLTLALRLAEDDLWLRCGREPSGNPFNSLVQLEVEAGIPRNPFINAGALVVTDIILSHLEEAQETVLEFLRELAGSDDIRFDEVVAASEAATGHRNAAMAHFLKSFGNLHSPADRVLDAYFHHCSIAMSCADLARACLFLADQGQRAGIEASRDLTEADQAPERAHAHLRHLRRGRRLRLSGRTARQERRGGRHRRDHAQGLQRLCLVAGSRRSWQLPARHRSTRAAD